MSTDTYLELIDERALADDLADKLAGTRVHVPPSKLNGIDEALARYREARQR